MPTETYARKLTKKWRWSPRWSRRAHHRDDRLARKSGLTTGQYKDPGPKRAASAITIENVMYMPEEERRSAWASAYVMFTGDTCNGLVVVEMSPAPRSQLESVAMDNFYVCFTK